MIGGGRTVGAALMAGSIVLLVAWLVWVSSEPVITGGGKALAIMLALLVLSPVFSVGFYVFRRGTVEKAEFAVVEQEKKILNMVLTQGQVNIGQLVAELQMPRETIEDMIRDLVGKQLFSGAINWEKGLLYSVESQSLTDGRKCPNCGSEVTFAGKGLIKCPYCGSEVFLTKRAAAATTTA